MTYSQRTEPFTDYLTVTYKPDASEAYAVSRYLLEQDAHVVRQDKHTTLLKIEASDKPDQTGLVPVTGGTFRVEERDTFTAISASGLALMHLRGRGIFDQYLSMLSLSPHRVTRLDATVDVYADTPDRLEELEATYPEGLCKLTRKAQQTKMLTSVRPDGRKSGTFYVGHRKYARVSARVYDKAFEQLERNGSILPPTTRYEMVFRKDYGVTLRDALNPASLFWSHCKPLLIEPPSGEWIWEPYGEFVAWASSPQVRKPPAQIMRDLVEWSHDLKTLLALADETGENGRAYLLRLVTEKITG